MSANRYYSSEVALASPEVRDEIFFSTLFNSFQRSQEEGMVITDDNFGSWFGGVGVPALLNMARGISEPYAQLKKDLLLLLKEGDDGLNATAWVGIAEEGRGAAGEVVRIGVTIGGCISLNSSCVKSLFRFLADNKVKTLALVDSTICNEDFLSALAKDENICALDIKKSILYGEDPLKKLADVIVSNKTLKNLVFDYSWSMLPSFKKVLEALKHNDTLSNIRYYYDLLDPVAEKRLQESEAQLLPKYQECYDMLGANTSLTKCTIPRMRCEDSVKLLKSIEARVEENQLYSQPSYKASKAIARLLVDNRNPSADFQDAAASSV